MMGWESEDFLQQAVDTCTNASGEIQDCALFDIQSDSDAATCAFEIPELITDDDIEGVRDGLALSIPIQSGPAYASTYAVVLPGGSTQGGASASATSSGASSATSSAADLLSLSIGVSAIVPTLSYSAATASVTDKYGGGILLANSASTYAPSSTTASADSTITEAASTADAAGDGANIVATSLITSAGEVVEMYIQEVDYTVTATATATAAAKNRRHAEQHQHRRVRHNGHL